MSVYIRFECGRESRYSKQYGPFDWLQMTYDELRIPPEGNDIIAYRRADGDWETDQNQIWSDFILTSNKETDPNGSEHIICFETLAS